LFFALFKIYHDAEQQSWFETLVRRPVFAFPTVSHGGSQACPSRTALIGLQTSRRCMICLSWTSVAPMVPLECHALDADRGTLSIRLGWISTPDSPDGDYPSSPITSLTTHT
jgi:hypothetical protein